LKKEKEKEKRKIIKMITLQQKESNISLQKICFLIKFDYD